MYSLRKNRHRQLHWGFIMATHNRKGDSSSLWSIYLFVIPPSLSVYSLWIFPPFSFRFFERHTRKPCLSRHSLSKSFLERHLVLFWASVVSSNAWLSLFSFILIDELGTMKWYLPADPKYEPLKWTPNPTPRWQLYVAVSCVWFTCGSLIMPACDSVWFLGYFDSLQASKRPCCVWSDIRGDMAWKAGIQPGEDQKRHKL